MMWLAISCFKHPGSKIVDVGKMIVERLPVNSYVGCQANKTVDPVKPGSE